MKMAHPYTEQYLSALLDYSFDLLYLKKFGVNHAEFIFIQIWQVLIDNPELKQHFLAMVNKSILQADINVMNEYKNKRPEWFVDGDLICFIAHVSRWSEFKHYAHQRKKMLADNASVEERDISDCILDALLDSWEDSDFYESLNTIKMGF